MPQDDPVTLNLPQVALLASPLLGPAVWRSTAAKLADHGWDVLVVPGLDRAPGSPHVVLKHLRNVLPVEPPLALVAHSNAGLYLPTLAAERRTVASVFVDAALPAAAGTSPLAPPAMHGFLRHLAGDDGLLPPWTDWWPEEQLTGLFPDAASRSVVAAEQHRVPLTYFTATLDAPVGWTDRPAAYLAFDDTYQAERELAERWGWRVQTLPGGHLHQLVDPDGVAGAIDELLRQQLSMPSP